MALLVPKEDRKRAWRTVFKGPAGVIVLCDILDYLGYYDEVMHSEAATIKHNTYKWMFKKMGIYKDKNIMSIAKMLADMAE